VRLPQTRLQDDRRATGAAAEQVQAVTADVHEPAWWRIALRIAGLSDALEAKANQGERD
jgi:hypothetical protein